MKKAKLVKKMNKADTNLIIKLKCQYNKLVVQYNKSLDNFSLRDRELDDKLEALD